jgi:hypothetical protein
LISQGLFREIIDFIDLVSGEADQQGHDRAANATAHQVGKQRNDIVAAAGEIEQTSKLAANTAEQLNMNG